MELFKIDPGLAIWTWIVFGLTFMILWEFAFPYILTNIKNREKIIADSINKASLIERRLSDIEKEQTQMISESRIQANEILRQTRLQAEILRKDLLEKAGQEARDVLAQVKIKIEEERMVMVQSIKSDIADFVCETSEKVIGRSFVSKKDHDWVNEMVETL